MRPRLPADVRANLVDALARLLLADLERRPVVVEGTEAVSNCGQAAETLGEPR
jgi:hypothetical protein